jgi:TonB family protein
VSSAALRIAFVGASVAVHGAVFVAMGHPSTAAPESAREVAVAVLDEATPSPAELLEPQDVAKEPSSAHAATHTHSYPVSPDHDAHPHDPSIVHLPFAPAAVPTAPATRDPAPDVIDAPPSPAPARFTMVLGASTAALGGAGSALGAAVAPSPGSDAAPLSESQVSRPARMIGTPAPTYPALARAQEIEAEVVVSFVVTTVGTVTDVQIVTPAGYGFDEAVLNWIRTSRFVPAERDGHMVAVRMRFRVPFELR